MTMVALSDELYEKARTISEKYPIHYPSIKNLIDKIVMEHIDEYEENLSGVVSDAKRNR
jgi:hypothetical protein